MTAPHHAGVFETIMYSLVTLIVGVLTLLLLLLDMAGAQVPEPVALFEQMRSVMPRVQSHDKPLGGLSLCKLLDKRQQPQPFFAVSSDRGEDTCDLSKVMCAYGCFCVAGVEDVTGPHYSQPICPSVEIVAYGEWTVIYPRFKGLG
jgi:hypothetical protein